jgi:hypothetical protein
VHNAGHKEKARISQDFRKPFWSLAEEMFIIKRRAQEMGLVGNAPIIPASGERGIGMSLKV